MDGEKAVLDVEAEAEVAALNRRIVLVEEDLERTEDRLKIATSKLEEASKAADEAERLAEAEVAALNRRMTLLEEELERAEERLKIATEKLEEATHNVDESERARKSMETRSQQDEERANFLETQVDEAKVIAEDADRKYEEVCDRQPPGFM
ncbi:Tropomyosin [Ancylostoma ceylanicum]|uniref:Tropomyosin n=1 Tax=Ancylostoma ceylanicum TaxID=53326 RepID=A0A0D6LJI8_9BILA|nr:Tropomyosin [Ancylostoma ceylanicum]